MRNQSYFEGEPLSAYDEFELREFDPEFADELLDSETRHRRPGFRRPSFRRPPGRRPHAYRPRRSGRPVRPRPPYPPRYPSRPRPVRPPVVVLPEPRQVSPPAQGSEYIRWVQSTLNQVMNLRLPVDGIIGVQTRSAIRDFQRREGLVVDGIVGPDTKAALQAARRRLAGQPLGDTTNGEPAGEPDQQEEGQFFGLRPNYLSGLQGEVDRRSKTYIQWIQQSLNKILGLRLAVDGIIGSRTRSAIRSFQQRQGLKVDGIAGSQTEAAIKAALGGSPSAGGTRMVDPAKVSCARYDRSLPIFKAIGTTDPVGVLEAVSQRAVAMLDNTIAELTHIRERVRAGEPLAWPLLNDLLAWSLSTRMLMRVNDPAAWTGRGPRTAEQIIRWLSNIRKTIAGGHLWYTCLAKTNCRTTTWAWVYTSHYRIYLCRSFWRAKSGIDAATHLEFQAQTIIHEVSHIYYVTEDSGRGPGHAECISQFVADANGSPIDEDFARRCGLPGPN